MIFLLEVLFEFIFFKIPESIFTIYFAMFLCTNKILGVYKIKSIDNIKIIISIIIFSFILSIYTTVYNPNMFMLLVFYISSSSIILKVIVFKKDKIKVYIIMFSILLSTIIVGILEYYMMTYAIGMMFGFNDTSDILNYVSQDDLQSLYFSIPIRIVQYLSIILIYDRRMLKNDKVIREN